MATSASRPCDIGEMATASQVRPHATHWVRSSPRTHCARSRSEGCASRCHVGVDVLADWAISRPYGRYTRRNPREVRGLSTPSRSAHGPHSVRPPRRPLARTPPLLPAGVRLLDAALPALGRGPGGRPPPGRPEPVGGHRDRLPAERHGGPAAVRPGRTVPGRHRDRGGARRAAAPRHHHRPHRRRRRRAGLRRRPAPRPGLRPHRVPGRSLRPARHADPRAPGRRDPGRRTPPRRGPAGGVSAAVAVPGADRGGRHQVGRHRTGRGRRAARGRGCRTLRGSGHHGQRRPAPRGRDDQPRPGQGCRGVRHRGRRTPAPGAAAPRLAGAERARDAVPQGRSRAGRRRRGRRPQPRRGGSGRARVPGRGRRVRRPARG